MIDCELKRKEQHLDCFDILFSESKDVRACPLSKRKAHLEYLHLPTVRWSTSETCRTLFLATPMKYCACSTKRLVGRKGPYVEGRERPLQVDQRVAQRLKHGLALMCSSLLSSRMKRMSATPSPSKTLRENWSRLVTCICPVLGVDVAR